MPERIEARPIFGFLGAALLLVALFLDWYEPDLTAWDTFEVWDVVLAVIAVLALYASFEEVSGRTEFSERWFLALALATLVIVISQILNQPPAAAEAGKEVGVWLALGAALLLTLAGLLSTARISLAVVTDGGGRRGLDRRAGSDEPPDAERPTEPVDRPL